MFNCLKLISFLFIFSFFSTIEAFPSSFTCIKLLGEGETSQVYLAQDANGLPIALKQMRSKKRLC